MFKTFSDFVQHAQREYGLPHETAEAVVAGKLLKCGLSPLDVVCYINWADGDALTQEQIGQHLGIAQQAVAKRLNKLKAIWPDLFLFGAKPPIFGARKGNVWLCADFNNCALESVVAKF